MSKYIAFAADRMKRLVGENLSPKHRESGLQRSKPGRLRLRLARTLFDIGHGEIRALGVDHDLDRSKIGKTRVAQQDFRANQSPVRVTPRKNCQASAVI